MTHLVLDQGNTYENVSLNFIDALYNIAKSNTLDSSSYLKGNLRTTKAYDDAVTYLTNKYSQLHIDVTLKSYIRYEEHFNDIIKNISIAGGDGTGVDKNQTRIYSLTDFWLSMCGTDSSTADSPFKNKPKLPIIDFSKHDMPRLYTAISAAGGSWPTTNNGDYLGEFYVNRITRGSTSVRTVKIRCAYKFVITYNDSSSTFLSNAVIGTVATMLGNSGKNIDIGTVVVANVTNDFDYFFRQNSIGDLYIGNKVPPSVNFTTQWGNSTDNLGTLHVPPGYLLTYQSSSTGNGWQALPSNKIKEWTIDDIPKFEGMLPYDPYALFL